jgi:CheY-like chemotaxis protein
LTVNRQYEETIPLPDGIRSFITSKFPLFDDFPGEGSRLCISDSGAPIRNSENEVVGVVWVFRDITDQVKEIASLGDVIKTSTNFVLRGTNVACDFVISDDLWLVDVDKGQVSQVIQNLVLNSKTAMPDGGRLKICGENVSQLPPEVLSEVLQVPHPHQKAVEGSGTIVLMDDHPMVQQTASEMLTHLGFEVVIAGDGARALEIYEQMKDAGTAPVLVIMDLTIPAGMGGVQAVERLLVLDPDARVVVLSGYSNDPAMAHYKDYGFKASLCKPFRLAEMNRVVQAVLSQ